MLKKKYKIMEIIADGQLKVPENIRTGTDLFDYSYDSKKEAKAAIEAVDNYDYYVIVKIYCKYA